MFMDSDMIMLPRYNRYAMVMHHSNLIRLIILIIITNRITEANALRECEHPNALLHCFMKASLLKLRECFECLYFLLYSLSYFINLHMPIKLFMDSRWRIISQRNENYQMKLDNWFLF